MDLFTNSIEAYYSTKSTQQLMMLENHLTYQLQVIDGTAPQVIGKSGKVMKPIPVTQMKSPWTEALNVIKNILQKRNTTN